MQNPTYLIKSRHDIYYFRYPLPIKGANLGARISISLRTRCPREALQRAKMLEYHSGKIVTQLDLHFMEHREIMALLKEYYAELLRTEIAKIDKDGALPKEQVQEFQDYLRNLNLVIDKEVDDYGELLRVQYVDGKSPLKESLRKIMDQNGLDFPEDSKEYIMLKKGHKFALRSYINELLAYNQNVMDFRLLQPSSHERQATRVTGKHNLRLGDMLEKYLADIKPDLTQRTYQEQADCLKYLTDWLGEDFPVLKLDHDHVQQLKALLRSTPIGRNKGILTRGLTLTDQIAAAAERPDIKKLSNTSINKYLTYFDSLFKWGERNRYVEINPFTGMRVNEKKSKIRREYFTKEEISLILDGLGNGTPNKLVRNKSQYWGALIAVYTGARRNEIAALTPHDVKKDEASGIWYFDISDEDEEGKAIKTDAAKRVVPVHSRLIELGFFDFLKESHSRRGRKDKNGFETRLLYDLTYTEHDKWGRNLGRWFNEKYLVAKELKSPQKTLHSLRHSLITYLSIAGTDNALIKSIVGHEPDTVTTQHYTHYGVEHLPVFKEALEKLPY